MSEDIAADVSYALQQVVKSGSGTAALGLGRPAAGKTGTSTNTAGDVVSAWFTGYTPQMATSVVYLRGNGVGKLDGWLPSYFGGDYPAETWTAVMQRDMEGVEEEEFPDPVYVDGDAPDRRPRAGPADADQEADADQAEPYVRAAEPGAADREPPTEDPTTEPTPTPEPTPTESRAASWCPARPRRRRRRRPRPRPRPRRQPVDGAEADGRLPLGPGGHCSWS